MVICWLEIFLSKKNTNFELHIFFFFFVITFLRLHHHKNLEYPVGRKVSLPLTLPSESMKSWNLSSSFILCSNTNDLLNEGNIQDILHQMLGTLSTQLIMKCKSFELHLEAIHFNWWHSRSMQIERDLNTVFTLEHYLRNCSEHWLILQQLEEAFTPHTLRYGS